MNSNPESQNIPEEQFSKDISEEPEKGLTSTSERGEEGFDLESKERKPLGTSGEAQEEVEAEEGKEPRPFIPEEVKEKILSLKKQTKELKRRIEPEKDPQKKLDLQNQLFETNQQIIDILKQYESKETFDDVEKLVEKLIESLKSEELPENTIEVSFTRGRDQRWVSHSPGRKIVILDRKLEPSFQPEAGKKYLVRVRDTQPGMMPGALIAEEIVGLSQQDRLKHLMNEKGYGFSCNMDRYKYDMQGNRIRELSEEELKMKFIGGSDLAEDIDDVKILNIAWGAQGNLLPLICSVWTKRKNK